MGRGEGCGSSAPVAPTSANQQHEAAAVPTHPSTAQRSDGNVQDAWAAGHAALPAAAASTVAAAPAAVAPAALAAAPQKANPAAAECKRDAPTTAAPPGSSGLAAEQRAAVGQAQAAAAQCSPPEQAVDPEGHAPCAFYAVSVEFLVGFGKKALNPYPLTIKRT